jgi:hypothetical protein
MRLFLNNCISLNFHLHATLGGWGRNTQTKIVFMDDWLRRQCYSGQGNQIISIKIEQKANVNFAALPTFFQTKYTLFV